MNDGKMTEGIIYMDHAATAPAYPEVTAEITKWFSGWYGNASSTLYSVGRKSEEGVARARAQVAALLKTSDREIFFTSGGTESDNWAVHGAAIANRKKGNRIITSAVEHHAVLECVQYMGRQGFDVTVLPVDQYGMVDPAKVREALTDDTILVSIMHANNEVGTINPIVEIGAICAERGVLFHTDAVQTVGKIPIDLSAVHVDLLSGSSHKFGGPKGCGFLYARKGAKVDPYFHGGGQERGKRSGTMNVPGIVGTGLACEIAGSHMAQEAARLSAMRDELQKGILERIPDVKMNGHPEKRLAGHLNVCVEGVEGESMVMCLDMNRVCVSSGSACTTGSLEPSHVLLAMGIPVELSHGSLRFTLGSANTPEQIPYVLDRLTTIVGKLRAMSPTYRKR